MAKTDDRMELIGSAILGQARQEARELIDKANAMRESEISRREEEVVDGMFGKVQEKAAKIRLESVKAIARDQLEAHRALLSHREKKTGEVFAAVSARLAEYAKTSEYKSRVLSLARELKEKYDHDSSVVFVGESDLEFGDEIAAALGGCEVRADASIRIGGFRLRNGKAGVLVDETLDERLEEQRTWFLQNCGMKVM